MSDMKGDNQGFLFFLFFLSCWIDQVNQVFASELRKLQLLSLKKIISLNTNFHLLFLQPCPFAYFSLAYGPQFFLKENSQLQIANSSIFFFWRLLFVNWEIDIFQYEMKFMMKVQVLDPFLADTRRNLICLYM